MNGDLMALVDELHALRNENAALRNAVAEQAVRIDEMLQHEPSMKHGLRYLVVGLGYQEYLLAGPQERVNVLAKKLANSMVSSIPYIAQKVEAFGKDSVEYRFAFISLGGAK